MNWNNYDTKYIIKRLIIGFGMLILFSILTTRKAHALTQTVGINYAQNAIPHGIECQNYECSTLVYNWGNYLPPNIPTHEPLKGVGEGNLIFTIAVRNATTPSNIISGVRVSNNSDIFTCDIGSLYTYNDSGSGVSILTANCPVNFKIGYGLKTITFEKNGYAGNSLISWSIYATFVSKQDVSVDVHQQQVVDSIVNSQTATIQAMEASSAIAHSDAQQAIQQAHQDAQQAHQDAQSINNSINNDNVDGANSDLDDFKNSSTFSDSTGLQAVIELPLNLVNSFTNTCQPIQITIPWLDYTGTIPCMSTIYRQHFSGLYSVVALIVNAFFIYRILLKIYEIVHNAKQPDEDKLEVIDL